jgi:citrate lyase gamma subunit
LVVVALVAHITDMDFVTAVLAVVAVVESTMALHIVLAPTDKEQVAAKVLTTVSRQVHIEIEQTVATVVLILAAVLAEDNGVKKVALVLLL